MDERIKTMVGLILIDAGVVWFFLRCYEVRSRWRAWKNQRYYTQEVKKNG